MSYTIVTDSSCNLPESIIDEYQLEILPLVFMIDGVERTSYLKGEVTNLQEFYTLMREGKVFTTSLPHLDVIENTLVSALEKGNDVLYLGFSSAISGTYAAVDTIAQDLQKRYPERKIICVETLAASLGEGLLVTTAAEMARNGADIEEVAQWMRDNRLHMCHWFTVDDLMYLYRGGRVSKTSAFAANLLSIKPVLHVDNAGALIPMEKVRSRKKSIKAMFEHMKETVNQPASNQTVYISHGDCIEDAYYLRDMIAKELGVTDFVINYVDPVIGAHSGPGTLALFYFGSER